MPNLTLRQVVMLTARTHFGQEGDAQALADAAQAFGVNDLQEKRAMETAKAALMRYLLREHQGFFRRINDFDVRHGGKKGADLIAAGEAWYATHNKEGFTRDFNVPALSIG